MKNFSVLQKSKVVVAVLAILCFSGFGESLRASGGYGGVGINQDKGAIDKEKYQLGKSIYNGELSLPSVDEGKKFPQYEKLAKIQTKLPRPEQRRTNLMDLAGKLDEVQLEALQHFVAVRFNVRLDN